ncbi:MAG: tetratricopeptide repeat protein [Crocosphaera sp.]
MPRAVILTSQSDEYLAVQSHLTELQEETHPQGTIYERGHFIANGQTWEIIIAEIEIGNDAAAVEAERAISYSSPDVILFVGVAGGVKDVKLGDVVAATKVYGYESGKEEETFRPRPDVGESSYNMIQRAKAEKRKTDWLARLSSSDLDKFQVSSSYKPKVFVDPIAAGEKVVTNKESDLFKFLQHNYGDAIAVEMAGRGILKAVYANQQVSALIIRGISYLIDSQTKAEQGDYQEIAARHASAFAFEVLAKFKVEQEDISQQIRGIQSNIKQVEEQSNVVQMAQLISSNIDSNLTDERHNRIDSANQFIKQGKLKEALHYLTNLKNELWHKADNKIKYRLLATIGMVHLGLYHLQEGASNLIQARQYDPDSETALALAARGHILHKQYEQAEPLIQKVLEKNSANALAYSLRVDMASDTDSLDEIINQIPEPYRNDPDVLIALGKAALHRKLYTEAEEWVQSAIDLTEGYTGNLKILLGTIILEPITQDYPLIKIGQLSQSNQQTLERGVTLFTELLQGTFYYPNDLSPLEILALQNRSAGFRLLSKYDEAIQDIELVLQQEPDNAYCIKQRALLAQEKGNEEEAYQFLQKILSNPEIPEASILAATSLMTLYRFSEAQTILEEFLQTDGNEKLKQEAKRLQGEIYLQLKDYQNAQNILEELLKEEPDNTFNLIFQIRLEKILNKDNINYEFIEKAKNSLLLNSSIPASFYLASELYHLKYYRDAAEIYEQFVDTSLDNQLTCNLLYAYYYSGNHKAALELCHQLLNKYEVLPYASYMAANIYESIGKPSLSRPICENYLQKFPDDKYLQLRLAIINYQERSYDKVDDFLETKPSIQDLDINNNSSLDKNVFLQNCFSLANLYKFRKRIDDFLDVIYEMRRRFYNEPEVHSFYTINYMEINRNRSNHPNLEQVSNNCGVLLRDKNGQEQWYILDDRPDADLAKSELNSQQELYTILLDKKIGDEIQKSPGWLGEENSMILAIQDKYFAAGKDSLIFLQKHPNVKDFQQVSVYDTEEGRNRFFNLFHEMLQKREDNFNKLKNDYKQGKITLNIFAHILGKNPLELWEILVNQPEPSIHTWSNFQNEKFEESLNSLRKGGLIVVDPISLLTLHQLDIADEIVKNFGNLGIAQSTINLFQGMVEELQGWKSGGFNTVGMKDGQTIWQEVSSENIEQRRSSFEQLIEWSRNNCDILPCWKALELEIEKNEKFNRRKLNREDLNQTFGLAFADTMLIASEPNRILYSDAQWLRWYTQYINFDSEVKGVWTQVMLKYCQEKEYIDEEKYYKATFKLIYLGYDYTEVDASILLEAARQSEWKVSHNSIFNYVLKFLEDPKTTSDSVARVSAEFIYRLYQENILFSLIDPRETLILELLKALTNKRSQSQIINLLNRYIHKRFTWKPLDELNVLNLIKIWEDGRTIVT